MKKADSPVHFVIDLFGGIRPLAKELKVHPSTVFRWTQTSYQMVPQKHWKTLMLLAKSKRKTLTLKDLIGTE